MLLILTRQYKYSFSSILVFKIQQEFLETNGPIFIAKLGAMLPSTTVMVD